MPYVDDIKMFVQSQEDRSLRCLILHREGDKGGVYGFFSSEITAGAVPDAAVIKELFNDGYASLSSPTTQAWDMNSLPLSHFVGLYQVTILSQRHNSVVDVYDGRLSPVSSYMGVGV